MPAAWPTAMATLWSPSTSCLPTSCPRCRRQPVGAESHRRRRGAARSHRSPTGPPGSRTARRCRLLRRDRIRPFPGSQPLSGTDTPARSPLPSPCRICHQAVRERSTLPEGSRLGWRTPRASCAARVPGRDRRERRMSRRPGSCGNKPVSGLSRWFRRRLRPRRRGIARGRCPGHTPYLAYGRGYRSRTAPRRCSWSSGAARTIETTWRARPHSRARRERIPTNRCRKPSSAPRRAGRGRHSRGHPPNRHPRATRSSHRSKPPRLPDTGSSHRAAHPLEGRRELSCSWVPAAASSSTPTSPRLAGARCLLVARRWHRVGGARGACLAPAPRGEVRRHSHAAAAPRGRRTPSRGDGSP